MGVATPCSSTSLAVMYDRLVALIATRPRAKIVYTRAGRVHEAYQALLDNVGRHL